MYRFIIYLKTLPRRTFSANWKTTIRNSSDITPRIVRCLVRIRGIVQPQGQQISTERLPILEVFL